MYGGWNWFKSKFGRQPAYEPETLPPPPVDAERVTPQALGGISPAGIGRYPIRDNTGRVFWWNRRINQYVSFNELPEDIQVCSMDNGWTPL